MTSSFLILVQVIVCAALYLKMKQDPDSSEDGKVKKAARIADFLKPRRAERWEKDQCIQFLMKSDSSIEDLVFMKPLRVKLKIVVLTTQR